MLEGDLKVVNRLGLHARAAAKLVRLAGSFKSRIDLYRADRNVEANAKSILSVLALGAAIGTELMLRAEGEDEAEAFDAIVEIFRSGFGENDI
jgi:phosphocarrier protein HPr